MAEKKESSLNISKKEMKNAENFIKAIHMNRMLNRIFRKKYDKEYKKRQKSILIGG